MASTHPLPLKTIESCRVAPPPGITPERAILPFTFFDVFWIALPPVEWLFFYSYPHPTEHFLTSLLPSLKSSLSLALKTYYPLAGGYRRTPGTDNKLEHYYVKGDAVSFTVSECNSHFEHLASDHERDVMQLRCLVPELPKSEELQPLLTVQVTVFPDQGIVIGTSVHHTACDGRSFMQFMHTWAETCLSGASVSSRVPPVFDRTSISDPSDHYSFFYNQAQKMIKSPPKDALPASKPSELVLATFTLKQQQIQRLKQLVSAKAEQRNTTFHCSTIVLTFAYVWTCFVRAKRVDRTTRVCIGIPGDYRARTQPPLPMEYFGNCVLSCMGMANAADLIEDDAVIVAAEAVGNAIDQLSEGLNILINLVDEYTKFSGVLMLSVAGSPKFKVYDVDFGLGRPTKVEIASVVKTGAMSVAESRNEEGGVEIGIAFPKDEMDCFNKNFFDGLKLLSE